MRIAHITPPAWTVHYSPGQYRMALAHWVIDSPDYTEAMKEGKRLKKEEASIHMELPYTIMDNGAFEYSQPSLAQLDLAAKRVDADEIVLPDVPGNPQETLKKSWDALKRYKDYRVMFVPQGTTVIEWKKCLDAWLTKWNSDDNPVTGKVKYLTIGVASLRDSDTEEPIYGSKTETLEYAVEKAYKADSEMNIHILGMTKPRYFIEEILPFAAEHAVRGVDTSTAFALGARGILLTADAPKIRLGDPAQYTQLSTNQRRLIHLNRAILEYWVDHGFEDAGIREGLIRKTSSRWLQWWTKNFERIDICMRVCGMTGSYFHDGDFIRPYDDKEIPQSGSVSLIHLDR